MRRACSGGKDPTRGLFRICCYVILLLTVGAATSLKLPDESTLTRKFGMKVSSSNVICHRRMCSRNYFFAYFHIFMVYHHSWKKKIIVFTDLLSQTGCRRSVLKNYPSKAQLDGRKAICHQTILGSWRCEYPLCR